MQLEGKVISVLLVDDHAMVRNTLAQSLRGLADIRVAGMAENAESAVAEAVRLLPEVIVMDIDMPGMIAFEAARVIRTRCPETRIIFLRAFFHDRYIEQALAVEASGYVTKSEPLDALLRAIRGAAGGRPYYSKEVLARLVITSEGAMLPKQQSRASALTPRELEVLRYLARGLTKKEVAQLMHISVNTVNRHSDSRVRDRFCGSFLGYHEGWPSMDDGWSRVFMEDRLCQRVLHVSKLGLGFERLSRLNWTG